MKEGDLVRIGGGPRGNVICSKQVRLGNVMGDVGVYVNNDTLAIMLGWDHGYDQSFCVVLVDGERMLAPTSLVRPA